MQFISPLELKSKIDANEQFTLLDVRENYERDICLIESTVHIPMAEVVQRISDIPEDMPVIVMCKSGKRALAVANLLMTDYDRENVFIVKGGILGWIEQVDDTLESY